jgi:hypothetical protein
MRSKRAIFKRVKDSNQWSDSDMCAAELGRASWHRNGRGVMYSLVTEGLIGVLYACGTPQKIYIKKQKKACLKRIKQAFNISYKNTT